MPLLISAFTCLPIFFVPMMLAAKAVAPGETDGGLKTFPGRKYPVIRTYFPDRKSRGVGASSACLSAGFGSFLKVPVGVAETG